MVYNADLTRPMPNLKKALGKKNTLLLPMEYPTPEHIIGVTRIKIKSPCVHKRDYETIITEEINDNQLFLTYHGSGRRILLKDSSRSVDTLNEIHNIGYLPSGGFVEGNTLVRTCCIPRFNGSYPDGCRTAISNKFAVTASLVLAPGRYASFTSGASILFGTYDRPEGEEGQCRVFVQDLSQQQGSSFEFDLEKYESFIHEVQIIEESVLLIYCCKLTGFSSYGDLHIFNLRSRNIKGSHKVVPGLKGSLYTTGGPLAFEMPNYYTLCLLGLTSGKEEGLYETHVRVNMIDWFKCKSMDMDYNYTYYTQKVFQ